MMKISMVVTVVIVCLCSSQSLAQDNDKQPFSVNRVFTTDGDTAADQAARNAIQKLNTIRKIEPADAKALIDKTFGSAVPIPDAVPAGANAEEQEAIRKATESAQAQQQANREALGADYVIIHIVQWKTEAVKGGGVTRDGLAPLPRTPGETGGSTTDGGTGVPVLIALGTPGQRARLNFDGKAGAKISLNIQGLQFAPENAVDISIVQPDGSNLLSDHVVSKNKLILIPALPVTGTYTILINPQHNTGTLNLAFANVPDDVTGTISSEGGTLGKPLPEPKPAEPQPAEPVTNLVAKLETTIERWYLYKRDDKGWVKDKFEGLRLYGSKKVALLAIHLDADPKWEITYDAEVRWKIPDPFKHAFALAGVLREANVAHRWGGGPVTIKRLPVDINLTGTVYAFQQTPKEFKQTYDNEGKYYYDVSVGLPVISANELKFDATDNIVRTKKVEQQKAFAFVNFFYPKVDTKDVHVLKAVHFLAGVPLTGKPLNHPIVGTGFGINKLQLFFGIQFNKEQRPTTVNVGDPATQSELDSQLKTRWVRKFVMGINVPVFQFLKSKDAK